MDSLFDQADAWVVASDRGDEPPPPDFIIPDELLKNESSTILISTPSIPIHDIVNNVNKSNNKTTNSTSTISTSNSPWMELRCSDKVTTMASSTLTPTPTSVSYGWYAKQAIPAGTRLMVAKPIAMVMDWEDDEDDNNVDDINQNINEHINDDDDDGHDEEDDDANHEMIEADDNDEKAHAADTEFDDYFKIVEGVEEEEDHSEAEEIENEEAMQLVNAEDSAGNMLQVDIDDDDDVQDDHDDDDDEQADGDGLQYRVRGDDESEPKLNQLLLVQILEKLLLQPNLWTLQLSYLYPRTDSDVARLPTWVCHDDTLFMQAEQLTQQLEDKQFYGPNNKQIVQQIAKRLPLIVRYNILSIETCCELLSYPGAGGHSDLAGVGLYCLPSFFNHTRTPNCTRWSVGDVMVFVANQLIPKDSEVCISYIEHDILCENSYRRNQMLRMDFHDNDVIDNNNIRDDDNSKSTININTTDTGPDIPVVDPDVQNELMSMDPFERLQSIDELLKRALGYSGTEDKSTTAMIYGDDSNANMSLSALPGGGASVAGDTATTADMTTTAMITHSNNHILNGTNAGSEEESGPWFQCDVQNLRILKAITFDGLGQHEEALSLWEETIQFLDSNVPPNDENLIVLHTQAALCSFYIYSKQQLLQQQQQKQHYMQTSPITNGTLKIDDSIANSSNKYQVKAYAHATDAVKVHNLLFGGALKFFRRRMKRDLELALRPKLAVSSHEFEPSPLSSPVDKLWPIEM
jgi:SET domain